MSKNARKAKPATHEAALATPSHAGNFCTMRIEPGEEIPIAGFAPTMLLVVKNYGPATLQLDPGYQADWAEILPGRVWATEVRYMAKVRNQDDKPTVIAMHFTPSAPFSKLTRKGDGAERMNGQAGRLEKEPPRSILELRLTQ